MGFAAKDVLANFFGTLMLLVDKPFVVGDWIRSPDREIEGTVEDVGWRTTRIRTFDRRPLYVPNANFASLTVENPQRMENRRIYETFSYTLRRHAKSERVNGRSARNVAESSCDRRIVYPYGKFGYVHRVFCEFLCVHIYKDHRMDRISRDQRRNTTLDLRSSP